MNSIPASALVAVNPNVLGAGGNPLSLNMVMLTQDPSIPLGTVAPFASASDVSAWFGPNAPETNLANIYFQGFTNSDQLPGTLYFAQYNSASVAAYVRSASVAGLTLSQLQALSGTLSTAIDNGPIQTSAAINLSAASSFSNAAMLMSAGFVSGTAFTGTAVQTASSTTVDVTAVVSGVLGAGSVLTGTGVTVGTTIESQILPLLTGEALGGVGRYVASNSTGFASTSVTAPFTKAATVTYDTQRQAFVIESPTTGASSSVTVPTGTLAPLVNFTVATGAVSSAGAIATTPSALMNSVTAATQNFATFMTAAEVPDATKTLFANWNQTVQNGKRYLYVVQDSNPLALQASQPTTFGALVANYNGIAAIYDSTGGNLAAFIGGITASIDFDAEDGRITYAYKGLGQLVPQITDQTTADNLEGNGYNFYGQYATADEQFQMLQPGSVSGGYKFIDAFVNQVYFNNEFQLAYMTYFTSVKSIPYNNAGYTAIRSVMSDPINAALSFGAIQENVQLSSSQIQEVNAAAGLTIDGTLSTRGWYLQVVPASPTVRAARGPITVNFWYTDGGSIQKLTLNSTDVQ